MRARTLAAAAALAAATAAWAQPYDPAFRWRTLETPHFRVHFHQGEEALAQDVAREAERAHARLVPRLGHAPSRRTEVVLSDDVDDANGSATPLPYNTIRLYAVPPSSLSVLNDYRDWLRQLVEHEYVHILHLDNVGGLPAGVNGIFGKLWIPNGLVPAFVIEGLAVANESDGPGAGRNASAQFDMYARALALDGPFPGLDDAANPYLDWPVGNVPYLLGGRFLGFLEARHGAQSVAGFVADQGAQVWPYAPSWASTRWFGGKSFPELWDEYAAAERAYAEGRRAWVRSRPVTEAAPLTRRGGLVETPRFSPDGRFVAYHSRTLDDRPGVRRVALDGEDLGRAVTVDMNGTLALRSPREAVVAMGEVYREYRLYDDLWLVDLEDGDRRRLTRGERATDPDVAPGGETLVYVRRTGGGSTALVRRALRGGEPEILFAHGGAEVYRPRVAPGGAVAFELHEGGRRDVALWREGRVERITDDDAMDTGPTWTPDGRFLLFASDRGGVFNLYAWEVAAGTIRQVTNLELGAFQPDVSPDGKTIVFVGYSRAGYDLATIPFDERTWMEPLAAEPSPGIPEAAHPVVAAGGGGGTAAESASASAPGSAAAAAAAAGPASAAETDLPSRPYSPWPTLRPTFWFPLIAEDGAGTIYGALTAGADVLLRHAWAAQAWWSVDGGEPGYAVAYQGGWSWPRFDVASSLFLDESPGPPDRLQRVWTYADTGLTFTFTRLARALEVRTSWAGTRYESVEAAAPGPVPEAIRFEDGFLSEVAITALYTDARRYVRSISPEEGRTLTLRLGVAAPELGSDYALSRAQGAIAQYLRVPFTRHTVLAARLSGGVADGTIGTTAPFELGGVGSVDPFALLPGAIATAEDQLRGYEPGSLAGTAFVLGNVELRFPLAAPGAGQGTWPIFLRRVHGAVFLDVGDAFDRPGELPFAGHGFDAEELRFSTGAELRLEIVLGYHIRTDLRAGVAFPLGALLGRGKAADRDAGLDPGDVAAFVTLGASF